MTTFTRARAITLTLTVLAVTTALLPSSAALSAKTISARQRFFGAENVDASGNVRRDRVIMSWVSAGGFTLAIDGHVVLLDAYIHKGEDRPNYVPATVEDLVALEPEALMIGHGHFDHAANSGEIAARTGATVIGTPEHCDQATAQAARYAGHPVALTCVGVVDRGSAPGAQVNTLTPFGAGVSVTALKHLHSAAEPPDGEGHETSLSTGVVPDVGSILLHPPGPSLLTELLPGTGDEGSSILYQFEVGAFTLVWNDTGGPLRSQAPGVLTTLAGLESTDVEFGSVLGFNDPTNGMRDIVDYVVALKPKVFFPNHHDFVAEYGMSKNLEGVFRRELAKRAPQPTEVRWLYDPYDYVRPHLTTFDIADPRFAD